MYDVSSFATHTMVPSLASDGQVNEFECNFDLQKNKNKNCQQSYKYQQEEQPPLLSLTVKQKIPQQHMTLEINVMSWNKQKNTTGLYRFNGFQ